MVKNYINRFRNHLMALVSVLLLATSAYSQTFYINYTGTAAADERRPYGVYFGHERTQAVYLEGPTELNLPVGSIIDSIGFFLSATNNAPNLPFPVKIYMREVASPTVTTTTAGALEIPANLVYSGDMVPADWSGGAHWVVRKLTPVTPLITTGGNLEIFVMTDWQFYNTCCGFFPQPGNPNNITFAHNSKATSAQWWQNDNALNNGLNGTVQGTRPNLHLAYVAATPCVGTPPVTTANTSATPVCAVPFSLSLAGVPPQSGFTFQWYSSTITATGPWTLIGGATFPFYQTTQTQQTWYYCQVTCTNGGASTNSTVRRVDQNPATNCYCASAAGFTGDGDIGQVSIGSMTNGSCTPIQNNSTATSTYTNFTSTVSAPNLQQGLTYPISLCQITLGSFLYTSYFNTFIDYNRDGTFDPLYERVYTAGNTSNTPLVNSFSGTVTIPFSSGLGVTRMRVILREGGNNTQDPCGTFNSWGETEDYNVNITPGVACGNPVTPGNAVTSLANVCSTQSFTLSITGNTTIGSGQTWQWQSAPVAIGPWSNIAGATLPFYTTTQAATTWYRCVIVCSAGTPANTAPVQVNSNSPSQCYCNTGLHSVDCNNYWISNVTLATTTLNNSTGCSSGNGLAYTAYPATGSTTASVQQNSTYNISVTTAGTFSQSISVWIDWNGSGTFEPTEWYGITGNPATVQAVGTYTLPVTVPVVNYNGSPLLTPTLTGMRVRSRINNLNAAGDACTQFGSGETEDYLITLVPFVPPSCTSTPLVNIVSSNLTPCSGQSFNLTLSPFPANSTGLTYQWQLDTGAGFQNIGGATASILTTSQARYTQYRVVVTCTLCVCASLNSNVLVVDNGPAKWLGFDNDWSNPMNWCGRVPTLQDSVLISFAASGRPVAQYKPPVVTSASLAAYNLELDATDSLTVLTDSLNGFAVAQHIVNNGKVNISSTKADTLQLSNGTGVSTILTPFRGSVYDNLSQFIYTFSELYQGGTGLRRNDVIDSLFFHIRSRNSSFPYQGFTISYGFTSQNQYTTATPITGLTQIYSGNLNMAAALPGSSSTIGGTLKLPVSGFQWTDTTQNMVLQICFHTTSQSPVAADYLYYTVTSAKTYIQLSYGIAQNVYNGCTLDPATQTGIQASFTPSQNRPNITFRYHRPQKPLTGTVGTAGPIGGGLKNNASASRIYISNTNLTVNGAVNNDGILNVDTSAITTTGDFFNNATATTDMGYKPSGVQRRSTLNVNGTTGLTNNGIIKTSDDVITIAKAVVNAGTLNLDSTAFTIGTDFTNDGTTDLSYAPTGAQRKSTIFFNGTNWLNNNTFIAGNTSRVVFGGILSQTLGGTAPSTFWDFRMEKDSIIHPITLQQPITINDSLSLAKGRILMNAKTVTINNTAGYAISRLSFGSYTVNASLVSEDSLSKLIWNMGTVSGVNHIYPFSNAAATPQYIPDTIVNGSVADLGYITMATYAANSSNLPYPPNVTHINNTSGANNTALTADRYWIVSKTGPANTTTNITFAFTDNERTSNNTILASTTVGTGMSSVGNPARAQPWGPAGGWRVAPGTQIYSFAPTLPAAPGYLSTRVNNVRINSYAWTFGNTNSWAIATTASPLPIKLLSFNANEVDDRTKINWVTASEENNDYFTVERTFDFSIHTEIARVASQGNSTDMQYYETWDNHPKSGINYYRLMQTDRGGLAQQVSDYVAVRFGGKSTFDILYITNESEVQVTFDYNSEENVNYTVTDMVGKTMVSGSNYPASPGLNILKLDASTWPHGMYLITLQNSEKTVTHKLVY